MPRKAPARFVRTRKARVANRTVDYLTQDSIAGGASGALPPHRGEAHVVTFTVGIAFGR